MSYLAIFPDRLITILGISIICKKGKIGIIIFDVGSYRLEKIGGSVF